MRHTMSNHITLGMMDAALCNIIFFSFMDCIQAYNVIYN